MQTQADAVQIAQPDNAHLSCLICYVLCDVSAENTKKLMKYLLVVLIFCVHPVSSWFSFQRKGVYKISIT